MPILRLPSFPRRRAAHLRLGRRGESLACRVLATQGVEILVRNYRSPRGELDIVGRDGVTLCFIEVKTRRKAVRTTPGDAVGRERRARMVRAGDDYLRDIGSPAVPYRFDIVEIVWPRRGRIDLAWHAAAFTLAPR